MEGFESPTDPQGVPTAPSQLPPGSVPQQYPLGNNPTGHSNNFQPSGNTSNFHPTDAAFQNTSNIQTNYQPFQPSSAQSKPPSFQPLGFQPAAGFQRSNHASEAPSHYYPPLSVPNQTSQPYLQATSLTSASLPTFLPMPVPPSSNYQQVIINIRFQNSKFTSKISDLELYF